MLVEELARLLEADFEGDGKRPITGVAEIDSAGPEHVAFAAGSRGERQAAASRAGCLLVPKSFPSLPGRTLIRVDDPRAAFARVVRRFHPPRRPEPGIHPAATVAPDAVLGPEVYVGPQAVIESGARVGARTVIGAGCYIGSGSVIGEDGLLYANVTVYSGVEIGRRAVIHSGAVLGADGFGFVFTGGRYEKFPQIGRVEIGDDVEIGANCCIDRAALGATRIGDGVKLDNMVHVAHNVRIGNHVVIAAQTGISGGVVIEDYAVIGGQVGLGDKARIERGAVLGSGCGVLTSKVIRAGQTVWGTPARPLKEYLAQLAELSRIAGLRKQVAELRRRVEKLEGREP